MYLPLSPTHTFELIINTLTTITTPISTRLSIQLFSSLNCRSSSPLPCHSASLFSLLVHHGCLSNSPFAIRDHHPFSSSGSYFDCPETKDASEYARHEGSTSVGPCPVLPEQDSCTDHGYRVESFWRVWPSVEDVPFT